MSSVAAPLPTAVGNPIVADVLAPMPTSAHENVEVDTPLPSLLTGRVASVLGAKDAKERRAPSPAVLTEEAELEPGAAEDSNAKGSPYTGKEPLVSISSASTSTKSRGPEALERHVHTDNDENEHERSSGDSESASELPSAPTTPPAQGGDAAGAGAPTGGAPLPSAGSALHASGRCSRCCFYLKGRCRNGTDCQFCHLQHEKRSRGRGCRGHGTSGKTTKEAEAPAATVAAPEPPVEPILPSLLLRTPAPRIQLAAPPGLDKPCAGFAAPPGLMPPSPMPTLTASGLATTSVGKPVFLATAPPGAPLPIAPPTPTAPPAPVAAVAATGSSPSAKLPPPPAVAPAQLPPAGSPRGVPSESDCAPAPPANSPKCVVAGVEDEALRSESASTSAGDLSERALSNGPATPLAAHAKRVVVPRGSLELKPGGVLLATPAPAPGDFSATPAAPEVRLLSTASPSTATRCGLKVPAAEAGCRAARSPSPAPAAAEPPTAALLERPHLGEVAGACRLAPITRPVLPPPTAPVVPPLPPMWAQAATRLPPALPAFPPAGLHHHLAAHAHAHFQAHLAAMAAARAAAEEYAFSLAATAVATTTPASHTRRVSAGGRGSKARAV